MKVEWFEKVRQTVYTHLDSAKLRKRNAENTKADWTTFKASHTMHSQWLNTLEECFLNCPPEVVLEATTRLSAQTTADEKWLEAKRNLVRDRQLLDKHVVPDLPSVAEPKRRWTLPLTMEDEAYDLGDDDPVTHVDVESEMEASCPPSKRIKRGKSKL